MKNKGSSRSPGNAVTFILRYESDRTTASNRRCWYLADIETKSFVETNNIMKT
jgi:hypothetical protein